ncbi:MAG: tRNA (adenosine(37)-N6)-threonylcarbamoyltransferase complex ATPase subunit type 1 TsaE [Anaerovoracaceae bacterium]|nr:tRNA (adenosine(37)-N6)-threonylcarbamoyltransferase complex ATPase subunit type 1 TsaE [Bacillota bacterium]MDY3953916.1 tRNA (adenosine(37)-N6)-threonylcarbamoyltransferase complex ATPase subunit type 1 TsaE [Anaerovoracaceae bacterium]
MKEIVMQNAEETEAFGLALAKRLKAGDIIAMTGNLGAGKTTLTKSIAAGLGIEEMVNSPTFTIVQEYRGGRLPLYHFDVYRVSDPDELFEIGYEDYFFGDGVCVVEWANQIEELMPEYTIWIDISYGKQEEERIYRVRGKDLEE